MLLRRLSGPAARHRLWKSASVASSPLAVCAATDKLGEKLGQLTVDVLPEAALTGDSVEILQEKNRRLRAKLDSMSWPRLTSFKAWGQTYTLPWSSKVISKPACPDLCYLAGFFDGDGCVMAHSAWASAALQVGQSCDGAEVLMAFQAAFGGSVRRLRDGKGLGKPSMRWAVYGQEARHAAVLLAPHSIVKRRQLQMAMAGPPSQDNREDWVFELSDLKRYDSAVPDAPSWGYIAGFFDAEGSICGVGKAAIGLSISQKHMTVLECLQRFLLSEMGINASLYSYSRYYILGVYTTSNCKQILEALLQSGMIRKAEAAKLALSLDLANASQVRASTSKLVGNQMFGKRMDQAGRERALHIQRLRARARYAQQGGMLEKAATLLDEVEARKCKHALLKARAENCQLRDYVAKILSLHQASNLGTEAPTSGEKPFELI